MTTDPADKQPFFICPIIGIMINSSNIKAFRTIETIITLLDTAE